MHRNTSDYGSKPWQPPGLLERYQQEEVSPPALLSALAMSVAAAESAPNTEPGAAATSSAPALATPAAGAPTATLTTRSGTAEGKAGDVKQEPVAKR